jgi:acyl-CoA thioester hydrolase
MANEPTPVPVWSGEVLPEWVDYNGHMNDAAYAIAFSRSVDAFMEVIGLGEEGRRETGHTLYTLAIMIRYVKEAKLGAPLSVTVQVLEHDAKRFRIWLVMRDPSTGAELATSEQLQLCVASTEGRAAPFPPGVGERLERIAASQAGLATPADAGKGITLRRS